MCVFSAFDPVPSLARPAETLSMAVCRLVTMVPAAVTVPTVEVEVTLVVKLAPPSEKSSAVTVILEVPSALARA